MTDVSQSGLVTIAGGKWTTYRSMAQDAVDMAIKSSELGEGTSVTDGRLLEGASGWTPTYFIRLVQQFGIEPEVSFHRCVIIGLDRKFFLLKKLTLFKAVERIKSNSTHTRF